MSDEPSDEDRTRLRLDIAYDGSGFTGWAEQPGIPNRPAERDRARHCLQSSRRPPMLTVAGPTDAGVHATGQVAHLDLGPAQLSHLRIPHGKGPVEPTAVLAKRLNGIAGLRSDVYVSRVSIAPPGFDARFSPIWRRYEYRIADARAERNPLLRGHTLWYPAALDEQRMADAASGVCSGCTTGLRTAGHGRVRPRSGKLQAFLGSRQHGRAHRAPSG